MKRDERSFIKASTNSETARCNFWAYGGLARPKSDRIHWQPGDELMGNPSQEEQGLNSVFDTDSTMQIVNEFNRKISLIHTDNTCSGLVIFLKIPSVYGFFVIFNSGGVSRESKISEANNPW